MGLTTAVLGVVCLGLRVLMLATGIDDKGLLVRGNVPNVAMWIIAVVYLAALWVMTGKLGGNGTYGQIFPQSSLGGWLSVAGGIVMISVVFDGSVIQRVMAIAAVVCMVFTGYCRYVRMRPVFWIHGLLCVYFLVSLITKYQTWSGDPQLHEYGFQMLACVMLMLYTCHRAACDGNMIARRRMVFAGMAACFFCIVALSDSSAPGYYAGSALWVAGSMCSLKELPPDVPKKQEK